MRMKGSFLTAFGITWLLATPTFGATIYNNLTPNNLIGVATRPDTTAFEIETGDDFVLSALTNINSASFVGLLVPGTSGVLPSISDVVAEIYRVFPLDSDTTRTPNVVTRVNSPSDVAFDSRASAGGELSFTQTILNNTFTVNNSVQPGGIHSFPNQFTGGNGALTGQEVQINVAFLTPFSLPSNHYFFVPQVQLSDGGQFYWISASRPISGAGTTPFPPGVTDLQAWTRDANLDPDWSRVGTDIVGGSPAPTFNLAFSLDGAAVPEPGQTLMVLTGVSALLGLRLRRRAR